MALASYATYDDDETKRGSILKQQQQKFYMSHTELAAPG